MRVYTYQVSPCSGPPVILKEGFSWGALLFGPFWFLWHGLWFSAILLLLLQAGLSLATGSLGLASAIAGLPSLALSILVGFNARDWWRLRLERQGYRFAGVVVADNEDQAEWKLMHRIFAESVSP